MSRKERKRRRHRGDTSGPHRRDSAWQNRRSDVVTVAWMVSTLATAAAGLLSLLGWWLRLNHPPAAEKPSPVLLFAPLMLFVAAVTGLVTLLMTPVVYRFRRSRPPLVITVFALAVGAAPFLVLFWLASR